MKTIFIIIGIIVLGVAGYFFFRSRPAETSQNFSPSNSINSALDAQTQTDEIFIDVRTAVEWNAGHADDALHFDLARLQSGEAPFLAKDSPIAVYCRTGRRAEEAKNILTEKGFTRVRNAGGLTDLEQAKIVICAGEASSCF